MKTPANCPGCGTKLEPAAEICPNCPMSFSGEDESEPNPLKHESRLRAFLMPLAFFGMLGFAVWKIGLGLMGLAQDGTLDEKGSLSTGGGPASAAAVAKTLNATSLDDLKGAGPAPGGTVDLVAQLDGRPQPGGSPPGESERVAVMAPDAADPGEGQGTISVTKGTGGTTARAVREWRLRGAVYDLLTLKPVAGAKLILTDNETNARAETVTNSKGQYRTVLPPLTGHGYLVAITKPGYAASYAGPESAGVSDLDPGSRKEMARQLSRSVEAPTSLEPGNDEPFVTNFFLAPLNP